MLFCRNLNKNRFSTPFFRGKTILGQFPFDAFRIGVRLVDFINCDDNRDIGSFGVIDGFNRLGHDTVIGGDNQNYNIGHFGAPGPHGGKRLVTRGVKKSYFTVIGGDEIGTDVLGNAAGFRLGHVGFTNNIEQGGFTVIDMSHDGNHRWASLQFFRSVRFLFQYFFFLECGAFNFIIKFCRNQNGSVIINALVDRCHDTHAHESLDYFTGFNAHSFCQLGKNDGIIDFYAAFDGLGCCNLSFLPGNGCFTFGPLSRLAGSVSAIV